jgi:hypothetical protein
VSRHCPIQPKQVLLQLTSLSSAASLRRFLKSAWLAYLKNRKRQKEHVYVGISKTRIACRLNLRISGKFFDPGLIVISGAFPLYERPCGYEYVRNASKNVVTLP